MKGLIAKAAYVGTVVLLVATIASAVNLVTDPGFESDPNICFDSGGSSSYWNDLHQAKTGGWFAIWNGYGTSGSMGAHQNNGITPASNTALALWQTITVTAGDIVDVSAWAYPRRETQYGDGVIAVWNRTSAFSVNGTNYDTYDLASVDAADLVLNSWNELTVRPFISKGYVTIASITTGKGYNPTYEQDWGPNVSFDDWSVTTRSAGDADGDGDVDNVDFGSLLGSFTGPLPSTTADNSDRADLIYGPETGYVKIDATEAAGSVIKNYAIENDANTFNASVANLYPFDDPNTDTATTKQISQTHTDPNSSEGIEGEWYLGKVFPTHMNHSQLESYLTGAKYVGEVGTGHHDFDLIVGPDSIASDFDCDGDADNADFGILLGNYEGPAAGNATDSGTVADLIYDPSTGNVKLDPTEAAGGVITNWALENGSDAFNAPGVVVFPTVAYGMETDTAGQISQTDVTMAGFSNIADLGNIFPTNLSLEELQALLSTASYVGTVGTGQLDFDLVVIPEPTTLLIGLGGLVGLLAGKRRGQFRRIVF